MIKKYKTGSRWDTKIEVVDVLRETAAMVFVPYLKAERRESKDSDWHRYHDTWEAAHAYLMERTEGALIAARSALQHAQDQHGNVKGMKKPPDA